MSRFNVGDRVTVCLNGAGSGNIGDSGEVVPYAPGFYECKVKLDNGITEVFFDSELTYQSFPGVPHPEEGHTVAHEAIEIVHGPRREAYGHPSKNFSDIAAGFSVIFGVEVTPQQVALANIWTKICRETNAHKRDNIVDIIGYALTHEMLDDTE